MIRTTSQCSRRKPKMLAPVPGLRIFHHLIEVVVQIAPAKKGLAEATISSSLPATCLYACYFFPALTVRGRLEKTGSGIKISTYMIRNWADFRGSIPLSLCGIARRTCTLPPPCPPPSFFLPFLFHPQALGRNFQGAPKLA